MERSTIIASVIAGAGILIAGSVAGTAAVNAAASSEPDPSTIQLLAAPAVLEQPALTTTDSADAAVPPPFTTEPLPAITATPDLPSGAQAEPSAGVSESAAATSPALPPEQAVALVLAATGGGATQDIRQTSRAGYDAWAVTVQRPDGSVVTGFVDRVTATVFDWRVVQEAPAPAPVTAGYEEEEYGEGEYEEQEEEHEEEEYEEAEHGEGEYEEHEGDEDDD
jgi:hypothetical protein